MARVLVAYATTYGSTQEVAEAVAASLEEQGAQVDLADAKDVDTLSDYDAVVLGAALYYFRLHKDARKFMARHAKALQKLPAALFVMGPGNDKEEEFASARDTLAKTLAHYEWFKPVDTAVFGGRFDPQVLRFPHNLPAMKKLPTTDARDWDVIRAWGRDLAPNLLSA